MSNYRTLLRMSAVVYLLCAYTLPAYASEQYGQYSKGNPKFTSLCISAAAFYQYQSEHAQSLSEMPQPKSPTATHKHRKAKRLSISTPTLHSSQLWDEVTILKELESRIHDLDFAKTPDVSQEGPELKKESMEAADHTQNNSQCSPA